MNKIRDEVKKELGEAKKNFSEINRDLNEFVEQYPWPAMVAATAIGVGVAIVGVARLTALAMENRALITDVLSKEFGLNIENLAKGFDFKAAATEAVTSAIGA